MSSFSKSVYPKYCMEHTKELFIIYLKFTLTVYTIFLFAISGNSIPGGLVKTQIPAPTLNVFYSVDLGGP